MRYSSITNQGDREHNEDSLVCLENGSHSCFVVADGLGGHGRGEVASALVTDVFARQFSSWSDTSVDQFLHETICLAQEELLAEQKRLGAKSEMKTTLVALCADANNMCWAHVGDSRLYAFRRNKVRLRTLDHSVPQMLVLAGDIKEKQIRNHPDRNRLLRVMGIEWDNPQYEVAEVIPVKNYQAFLLCSDGFWELIEEKQMGALLKKSSSPQEWLLQMEEIVKKNGQGKNMDNYTAVAVFCSE